MPKKWFDLIITPQHDGLTGNNVLNICGSLNNIDLINVKNNKFNNLNKPVVSLMIGGSNRTMKLGLQECDQLIKYLKDLHSRHNISLLVSFSRRTNCKFKERLLLQMKDIIIDFYDGRTDNPYYAYLSVADYIIVTADSISMTSEACSTGKPVLIYKFGKLSRKFREFHNYLNAIRATKDFQGQLYDWSVTKVNDMKKVVHYIKDNNIITPR